jgi:hypothetical protein
MFPTLEAQHLIISTLVAGHETNRIVKGGSATDPFGGKHTDGVWVEKKKVVSKNIYKPILFSSLYVIHPSVKHCNFSFFVFFGFSPALRKPVLKMDSLEEKFPTSGSFLQVVRELLQLGSYLPGYLF